MAGSIRVPVAIDLGDLVRDLDSVDLGLGKLLKEALGNVAETAAKRTRELWPVGPGPRGPKDNLPHMADTIAGQGLQTTAQVTSTHPGAPVTNWGGTIAPRGVPIHFPPKEYAQQAAREVLPRLEQQLDDEVNTLAARYLN